MDSFLNTHVYLYVQIIFEIVCPLLHAGSCADQKDCVSGDAPVEVSAYVHSRQHRCAPQQADVQRSFKELWDREAQGRPFLPKEGNWKNSHH